MSNFLIKIRSKSDKEKKIILFISTTIIMILVIVCWFSLNHFFGGNYKKINKRDNNSVGSLIKVFEKSAKNLGTEIYKTKDIFSQ